MTLFPKIKSKKHLVAETTFSDRVIKLACSIPPGKVSTYAAIARAAGGAPMAARSITGILGKAWDTGKKDIPFHRIVYSDGRVWMSPAYRAKRIALYKKEGIAIDKKDRIENFMDVLHEF